jgi:snRNA-activating protein complex subunit 3
MSTGSNQTASINAPLQPLHDVVITVSIHTPVPWATSFITRTSSHVLLSSHTLGDILDAVPCTSTELPPAKTDEDGNLTGFTTVTDGRGYVSTGAVICIDGVVYGDGESEEDYSE